MEQIWLNDGWQFTPEFVEEMIDSDYKGELQDVRIPHTVRELPYHYFDDSLYQMVSGYRKIFKADPAWKGKRVFVTFLAVAHAATVWLNGWQVAEHFCGYTAFEAELTKHLRYDQDNILTVRVDSRETLNVPPFGNVIDYMTYGGIYREVYLSVTGDCRMKDTYVQAEAPEDVIDPQTIRDYRFEGHVEVSFTPDDMFETDAEELSEHLTLKYTVFAHNKSDIRTKGKCDLKWVEKDADGGVRILCEKITIHGARVWDPVSPTLYDVKLCLYYDDELTDTVFETIGFRRSEFREDGYYINGRKFKLRGMNRHQSYAYTGYAMPASMQRLDADILRFELGVNAVRTSHYPQSHHFLNRCDELGLLVFTEFPGWQHIGDDDWKRQAVVNLREMILQYRNHASIILWGVRINESVDDDVFYMETNAVAHLLDPWRETGGVRYLEKSHLLEDVYTFNDFSHEGTRPGCKRKAAVTTDLSKAYLISEYNGHMFPTKAFDDEEHRLEHALRHANVLNAVRKESDIAGCFAWCMFDYNTHKDFGSGDRICYHGVMDMFRNPKLAAALYASQQNRTPVLEVSSSMDIGEHPGGNRGGVYIFTNADSVRMYRNDELLKEYTSGDPKYSALRHPPIMIDDYVGDRMKEEEGFTEHQNRIVKTALNHIARYGMSNIPLDIKLQLAQAMAVYRMTFEQAYQLYGKYVGNWGDKATTFRFEAIKDGKVVKTVIKSAAGRLALDVRTDHRELKEKISYDVAAIRVRVCDEYGNTVPFFNAPLTVDVEGVVELIGSKRIQIAGGMGGTYVRTLGREGVATVTISLPEEYASAGEKSCRISFTVEV